VQVEAAERFPVWPTASAGAALLMVSAGVTALARPLEPTQPFKTLAAPVLAPSPVPVRPATVRIILPNPRDAEQRTTGTVRIALPDLDTLPPIAAPKPELPAPDAVSLTPARTAAIDLGALTELAPVAPPVKAPEPAAMLPVRRPAPAFIGPSAIDRADAPAEDRARIVPVDPLVAKVAGRRSVALEVSARIDGVKAGRVTLLIRSGDDISIRLADLLAVAAPAMQTGIAERLGAAEAAQSYVTLNDLRAAGIAVRFDDDDRLLITTR
jgi:hypothetical protein